MTICFPLYTKIRGTKIETQRSGLKSNNKLALKYPIFCFLRIDKGKDYL